MNNFVRITLLGALVVVPISMIILAMGGMLAGIPAFIALALFAPSWLRRQNKLRQFADYPWRSGLYFYSLIGWVVFFYMGERVAPLQLEGQTMGGLLMIWLFIFFFGYLGVSLTAYILTLFFQRPRFNRWIDETLDVAVYALPIPMLLVGDILYMNLQGVTLSRESQAMIFDMMNLLILLTVVWTMGSIALYLFPRNEVRKAFRLLRILITAFVWLAINGHIFGGGWMPDFVVSWGDVLFPAFRGNPIVYITPGLIEFIVLGISIGLGMWAENLLIRLQGRYKTKEEHLQTVVENAMKSSVLEKEAQEAAKKEARAARKQAKKNKGKSPKN